MTEPDARPAGGEGSRPGAESALEDSEERFRLLVSSVVDYAIFMLDVDGNVTGWNAGGERLKGYREHEIVGRHFSVFYTEGDRAAGLPERLLAQAARDGRVEHEGWRVRKDGSLFWADVVITALRDDDGRLRGFGKVTRDLTARKQAEDARRDLIAIVAHDVRAPLGVITGLTSLLLDEWDRLDPARRREAIERVHGAANGLRGVVGDILDAARADAGELAFAVGRFDVAALARRVAGELTPPGAPARVHVTAPAPAWALGDERRTWQVLTNLVANALVHGGAEPVAIHVAGESGRVRVAVSDRGPGLTPEQAAGVFERYTRARSSGGVGLGLHIARSFVLGQGGEIGVESAPGVGATFWFRLPAS